MTRLLSRPSVLLALLFLVAGCGSSKGVQSASESGSRGGHVIDMDEVEAVGYSSIEDVLISRVPGVRRAPDGNGIIIRGPRSIQGNNQPLYVIDDVPTSARPHLSLTDVDEIEVLKDAAMLAGYGLRGQNGVILIRTKTPDQ
jgi:TonB-dependent SusC/RagA subfamily outer membrane receptor